MKLNPLLVASQLCFAIDAGAQSPVSVTYFLNGVKVNEGRDGSLKEGRILIQSEGAEMFFRNVELQPLKR